MNVENSDTKVVYATLGRRLMASVIDSWVLLFFFIGIPLLIEPFTKESFTGLAVLMYAPVFVLEPLLVSYWGQTVGQYLMGIRVVREADLSRCLLLLSFVRYYLKAVLGVWSLVYIFFSRNHKAIHDYVTHTVVILSPYRLAKSPSFAEEGMTEQKTEKDYLYPSVLRRFVLFIVWWVVTIIVMQAVAEGLLSLVVGTDRAEQLLESGDRLVTTIEVILLLVIASLSAKGLLPGAEKKNPRHSQTRRRRMQVIKTVMPPKPVHK